MIPALIVVGAVVLLLLFVVGLYNRLVRLRVAAENGWSQIDVQLKRRYDLIPNLVETVKGYASHEKGTLEAVVSARTRAVAAGNTGDIKQQAEAENVLTQALGRLIALSEAYPDLKANQNFLSLQQELAATENKIGFSRQHYNDSVGQYSEARQQFPSNIVANMFGFKDKPYFDLGSTAEQREAPKVSFS
jgi:LemA protein